MKSAALEYARAGIYVFPLVNNGKMPATLHGHQDAAIDPVEVATLWQHRPTANIGIATGASGLAVIDIDRKHGVDGWRGLADCLKRLGELPGPTRMVSTPSGGAHIYFRAPAGFEIRNSAGRLAPGVDVRACGGYVVAPPSVISGKAYRWDVTAPAKVLPLAWGEAMTPPKPEPTAVHPCARPVIPNRNGARRYGRVVINSEADTVRKAERGSRNDTITRSAFRVGQVAEQCGISIGQAGETFAWAVSHWGDDAEAHKAQDSFLRAFEAGKQSPRGFQWSR